MLIIRTEQIQHFIAKDDAELIRLIAQAIREANPERVADYDDAKLKKMTETGIERARSYEIERAEDIASFVALMFEIAPNFDEQDEIKMVLHDANFSVSDRLAQLWERTSDEAWDKAERNYKSNAWFRD
jgi:hypothetical protein